MLINEIMTGSTVKIFARIKKNPVLLYTKAKVGVNGGLLVEPVNYFAKTLELTDPCEVQIKNERDGRTYSFAAESILPILTKYGYFHMIKCTTEAEATNMRKAERFDVAKMGLISINNGLTVKNAIVYDISMRGISFIVDNKTEVKKGDLISAEFRTDTSFHVFTVEAEMVREFKIRGNRAIGCKIHRMSADVVQLIADKKAELDRIHQEELERAEKAEKLAALAESQEVSSVNAHEITGKASQQPGNALSIEEQNKILSTKHTPNIIEDPNHFDTHDSDTLADDIPEVFRNSDIEMQKAESVADLSDSILDVDDDDENRTIILDELYGIDELNELNDIKEKQ